MMIQFYTAKHNTEMIYNNFKALAKRLSNEGAVVAFIFPMLFCD